MGSKGPSSEAKAAKAEYERLAQEYSQKRAEFQNLVKENSGMAGYQKSVENAKGVASSLSQGQSQAAANQAIQAGRAAGQSKAAAAMNAQNAAANTYNQAYMDNFNNQQNQVAGQLNAELQGTQQANDMLLNQANMQNQIIQTQQAFDDKSASNSFWGRIGGAVKGAATGFATGGWGGAIAGGIGGAL